jgi:colicin import membrane protein
LFGIGGFELFIILLFGFLIFGPDKLPAIAKTVAQALAKFRSAQEEMTKVIKTEVYDPNSDEPFKNPLDVLSKVTGADKKEEKAESFSERKAKYDKERAAKKAAEEQQKTAAAAVAAAAAKAVPAGQADTASSPSGNATGTAGSATAASANATGAAVAAKDSRETGTTAGNAAKAPLEGAAKTTGPSPRPKPLPSADELYGNKPATKAAPKPAAASGSADPKPAATSGSAAPAASPAPVATPATAASPAPKPAAAPAPMPAGGASATTPATPEKEA